MILRKPAIILVSPQMGENIGATARVMKNFGLEDLRIVNPRDGWPNEKAVSTAVAAANIIHEAKIYNSLPKALENIEYLYATTAAPRDMNKNYILSTSIKEDLPQNMNIAIMFGRENSGLTNKEISYANKILTINTNPNFTSLNIAQAVAVICYELFSSDNTDKLENPQELATKQEMEYFFEHLFGELEKTIFFKVPEKTNHMKLNIRNIFTRIDKLSKSELQSLRGIINALVKKIP